MPRASASCGGVESAAWVTAIAGYFFKSTTGANPP